MHALAATLVSVLVSAQESPADEEVKAGWMGFVVFIGLILAVALIGWALTRSLRTAGRAKDAGVFGDAPEGEKKED